MQDQKANQNPSSKKRRRLRVLSFLVGILVVVGVTLVVMNLSASKANGASTKEQSTSEDSDEKAPVPVEIARTLEVSVSAYISSTANLIAEFEVKVLSEVEGRILTLKVDEGDTVKKGQVLATLVRDDEEISLKKAELKESNASTAYQRAKDLAEQELISREEYDKLLIDHGIAKQELAEAKWAMEKTTFRAPFAGRVTTRMTQVGQHIRPGDELFQVTDFDPLIARIYLPEKDVLGLTEGRDVRLRLNADGAVSFAGRIRQISPIVDTATGTVKVTVEAAQPPSGVRPGSFVTIDIVRETRSNAPLLPRQAVVRELQKAHVFVAQGGSAEKRTVRLGLEEGDFIEAVSGVAVGESVITAGQGGLKDGSPVKILEASQSAG